MRATVLLIFALAALCGCATPDSLTSQATGCASRDLDIVSSDFSRDGVETAWCARCKDKLYQCVTNVARDKVQCFEAKEGGPCY